MIELDIRADIRAVTRLHANLKKSAVKKAAARAINDVLVTLRAEGAREIKKAHPALTIGAIKKAMLVRKASRLILRGMVHATGKPQTLLLFRPSGGAGHRRRTGVRGQVSLLRSNRPITAMIGTKRSVMQMQGRKAFRILAYGNEVFVRRHAKGRQVRRLRGPSLPGVFRSQGGRFRAIANARWAVTFRSRMVYEIELAKHGQG